MCPALPTYRFPLYGAPVVVYESDGDEPKENHPNSMVDTENWFPLHAYDLLYRSDYQTIRGHAGRVATVVAMVHDKRSKWVGPVEWWGCGSVWGGEFSARVNWSRLNTFLACPVGKDNVSADTTNVPFSRSKCFVMT